MNELAYMLERSAKYHSERTAIICNREILTFRQVQEYSNALSRGLQKLGVQKGDRVAILLPNISPQVIVEFSLLKGGYVRVPLDSNWALSELEYILRDSGANTLVYGNTYTNTVEQLSKVVPTIRNYICVGGKNPAMVELAYEQLIEENEKSSFAVDVTGEDYCQILYTCGTNDRPKGMVTNVRSRIAALNNVFIDELNITQNDAMLHVASLGQSGGTKVLPHYVKGAANILMPKFTVEEFLDCVERYSVTTTWLEPKLLAMIIEHPNLKACNYSSLTTIVYPAAPMPPATLSRALEVFGNVFVQVYGLSTAQNPDLVLSKIDHLVGLYETPSILNSVGREVTNVRIRLIDEQGKDVQPGEIGEIIISGDNIMTEYWKLPEATAKMIRDGWLYTREMARRDEYGFIYIVGR